MTITDEIKKLLTVEVLGEEWDSEHANTPKDCNRTFDNDTDMMALFRKIVDSLKFGAFQNFAYKHFNEYPNYTITEWLFYDPERFCNLVAEWLEVKKWERI